jgi:catechol 2,3-dioxygenase-like lactoylglutathione lyase family enzyme
VKFYETVLGCAMEKKHPELGLYQLRAGDCIIDLVDVEGPIGREGGRGPGKEGHTVDHFCIRIEPFNETALRKHFVHHGIEPSEVLNNWGGDGRGPSIYVRDPAGNKVELKGPSVEPYQPRSLA